MNGYDLGRAVGDEIYALFLFVFCAGLVAGLAVRPVYHLVQRHVHVTVSR